MKPDLCAYYDAIYTTGGSATTYTSSFGGTSGAAPMVSGAAALLVATQNFSGTDTLPFLLLFLKEFFFLYSALA